MSEKNLTVSSEETYERVKRHALALMDRGFHLGGVTSETRDELHNRKGASESCTVDPSAPLP